MKVPESGESVERTWIGPRKMIIRRMPEKVKLLRKRKLLRTKNR